MLHVNVQKVADHPRFAWPLLLLKSKHGSFVSNNTNTNEYYSAYELLDQKIQIWT